MKLADRLFFNGLTFYFTGFHTDEGDRIYSSLDELTHYTIYTNPYDYDGVLIATISEWFRLGADDDLIRYFDSETGHDVSNYN